MALTKRIPKGSKLTHSEMDANWDWVNEGEQKSSAVVTLTRGGGNSHADTGGASFTGGITVDLTDAINLGTGIVKWSGAQNPTIIITNGTVDTIYPNNDSITQQGDYNIIFMYVANFGANGELHIYIPGADSTSSGDTTAPVLTSAVVEDAAPSDLVLTYNESLDATSTPATGDFSVDDGAANAVTNVVVSGTTVTLTLTNAIENGDTVTVSYTAGTNPIQDVAGNDAANLTNQGVTNNVSATGFTNSETQTYMDRLTALSRPLPSSGQQTKIDTFIGELKAAGVWAKADVISLMTGIGDKESSKVNLFPPASFELTETGTVSWTDAGGFASDGSSTKIILPFNTSTSGTNFLQDNNCMLVYYDAVVANGQYNFGNLSSSPLLRYHSGNNNAAGNATANTGTAAMTQRLQGLRRNSSASFDIMDGSTATNVVEASVGMPDAVLSYTGREGSSAALPTVGAQFAFVGGYLNNTEIAAVQTALDNYLA